jgi:DMSO/TMAO reductase YedYZ molybdopterin-dependent catalytic subunit
MQECENKRERELALENTNAGRTVNGVPKHAREFALDPVLRISGLVATPATLRPADFDRLPRVATRSFLTPDERSRTPDYDLAGILLQDLFALVAPQDVARFALFGAGPYTHPVALVECERVVICDRLDGSPIPAERGGPWRVLIPAHSYNMGVKWLDRIELTAEQPDDAATRIAEARERARQFHRARQNS